MRWRAAVTVLALVAGTTGCTSRDRSGSAPAPSTTVDAQLAAEVPAAIRSAGAVIVATEPNYEPSEFLTGDKIVTGFDVDLFNAVAGKLGVKTQWKTAKFDEIIPAVGAGTYHVGVSSFTIRKEREEQVTMVSYFSAGTQWAAKPGGTVDPDNACGRKVAVQSATVQVTDVGSRSTACIAAGKPAIQVDEYLAQGDVTSAVTGGKDDAMLADSPVTGYAVKQAKGDLALVGQVYNPVRYGYVLPKNQADFGASIARALRQLMAEGTYQSILDKWGVTAGAIGDPAVNP